MTGKLLLIFSAVAAVALSQSLEAGRCTPGCRLCADGKCAECYQSMLDKGVCDSGNRTDLNCDLYVDDYRCAQCDQGYTINIMSKKPSTCIPHNIDNCRVQYYFTNPSNSLCGVCIGGFPNEKFSNCTAWTSEQVNLEDDPSANCVWGTRNRTDPACNLCKKGYVEIEGICRRNLLMIGCQSAVITPNSTVPICTSCDVFDGYSMEIEGFCTRTGKSAHHQKHFKNQQVGGMHRHMRKHHGDRHMKHHNGRRGHMGKWNNILRDRPTKHMRKDHGEGHQGKWRNHHGGWHRDQNEGSAASHQHDPSVRALPDNERRASRKFDNEENHRGGVIKAIGKKIWNIINFEWNN